MAQTMQLYNSPHLPVTASHSVQIFPLSLFSNAHALCPYLNERDEDFRT